jgi:hypothetical protein
MADIDRIELLMRLSSNMRADNAEWRKEINAEGYQRYKNAMQIRALFEQEYANLDDECRRLEQYAPIQPKAQLGQEPQMPKVVTQGPKQ